MLIVDVLNGIIDDGIMEIRYAYTRPDQRMRMEGAIDGFESCRGKEPGDIRDLLSEAAIARVAARDSGAEDYWWHRMREAQIEFTASVLSVALMHLGLPTIATVTLRAQLRYAEIVGIETRA